MYKIDDWIERNNKLQKRKIKNGNNTIKSRVDCI